MLTPPDRRTTRRPHRRPQRTISPTNLPCFHRNSSLSRRCDERITAALGSNTQRPQHMKALHHSEVRAAVRTVEATGAHWATIAVFKFLTLTATRSGEVRKATWDEIHLPAAIWTIPPEHTKRGREHRVPLSTGALAVLATALQHHRSGGSGLVFPSPTGRVLSNTTMSKLCKENNVGCVPHGMKKLVSRLVRRNRGKPRNSGTGPRSRNSKRGRKGLRPNRPTGTTPRGNGTMEPLFTQMTSPPNHRSYWSIPGLGREQAFRPPSRETNTTPHDHRIWCPKNRGTPNSLR